MSLTTIGGLQDDDSSKTLGADQYQNDKSGECRDAMRDSFKSSNLAELAQLIQYTGKSINQFGDPEMCQNSPDTEYAILKVSGLPLMVEVGVCAPSICNEEDSYEYILDYANGILAEQNLSEFSIDVYFPYQQQDYSLGFGAWITICLTSAVIIFGLIGIFTEYSTLFEKSDSVPTQKKEERLTKLGQFFFSFSFKNNIEKLLQVSDRGDSNLKVINGVRVLSICWVSLGHSFMQGLATPMTNLTTALGVTEKWYFAMVPGGFFAADVFFFLSGFLTFYLMTTRLYPKRGVDNYPMIYFHRWFRLAIPAGYTMLLCMYIFKYLGDGPKYQLYWNMGNCSKTWWSSLLFIQNLYPWQAMDMCMSWFWYLANDFEFFLISPIIIFTYCKSRYLGYAVLGFVHLASIIYIIVVTVKYNFGIFLTLSDSEDFMHWLYLKPFARFGPYGVGALLGWAYFEYKQSTNDKDLGKLV